MKIEFINEPISGEAEEIIFDTTYSDYGISDWCWVMFIENNEEKWIGNFRGEALKIAYAKNIDYVAILTTQAIYILNIKTKELLYNDKLNGVDIVDIKESPMLDKFIFADDNGHIGYIDKNLVFKILPFEKFTGLKFKNYIGNKLKISAFYGDLQMLLDTETWIIEKETWYWEE